MNGLKTVFTALVIAVPLGLAAMAGLASAAGRITVTGEGQVEATPDVATIMMGVTNNAATAQAALADNSASVTGILARLKEAGIEDRDIQTSGLSLNPNFDYGTSGDQQPVINGFIASNTVTVRVRALGSLGGVLDTVVKSGANTFNGLTFGLTDPIPKTDEARKLAVADARRKAELYAEAAGVALGPILSISESTAFADPGPMMFKDAEQSSDVVPIAGGAVAVTALVTIEYVLSDR